MDTNHISLIAFDLLYWFFGLGALLLRQETLAPNDS